MNNLVAVVIGAQYIILVIAMLYIAFTKKEEKISRGGMAVVILLVMIGITVVAKSSEDYGIAKTDFPQKNLPFFVKSIRTEGSSDVYMEIVPYNDINASKQYYYKIPVEKFQELANITAGTVIINDNGIIKPFPITLRV